MRIGRTVYTQGMIIGLLVMAFLVALVVVPLVLWSSVRWDSPLHVIVISAAAGAVGAFVSVLQRMASEKSKFAVHYDLGKRTLYMLGSYRPVLGVVFGVFTYFVLASGILGTSPPANTKPLYYYGSLAFVAGFSERFTQVLAKSVEGLVPAQGTDEPKPLRARKSETGAKARVGVRPRAGRRWRRVATTRPAAARARAIALAPAAQGHVRLDSCRAADVGLGSAACSPRTSWCSRRAPARVPFRTTRRLPPPRNGQAQAQRYLSPSSASRSMHRAVARLVSSAWTNGVLPLPS